VSASSRASWFWSDWLGDQAVRRLTPAERGVWIDLLALMAAAAPAGYLCDDKGRPLTLQEIARVTNAGSPDEVAELVAGILDKGAASRDRTGRLFNRRMVRDAAMAAKKSRNGKAGGAATRLKWQAIQDLPQQSAWQMPQQKGRLPIPLSKKDSSSFPTTAREVAESPASKFKSAGSLATALVGSALTSPPITEQVEESGPSELVSAARRVPKSLAEVNAILRGEIG
jgi:hypothetical protein